MSTQEAKQSEQLSQVFAALGDTTRLCLVRRLAKGQARSIAQLASGMDITHQGATKHLKVLERCGLVHAHRVGRERHYECDAEMMDEASRYLRDVAREWDGALERLRQFVED